MIINRRMDIDKIKEGDDLITVEASYGQQRVVWGPVVDIDKGENIIAIRAKDGSFRSFPVNQLWSIPALFNYLNRNHNTQRSFNDQKPQPVTSSKEIQVIQVLAGFIKSVLEGTVSKEMMQEILSEIEKNTNIKPVRGQETLEALLNLSKRR